MASTENLSETRRNQILEAASNVFSRKGLQKARMDDIVTESGLSKGALYWYFKSKDDIIIAILKRFLERELDLFRTLVHSEGSAEDRLRQMVERVLADLKGLEYFRAIAYEFYSMAMRSKKIRALFSGYMGEYMDITRPIIEQGIRDGEFRDLDPTDVAIALGAILEGTFLIYSFAPDMVDFGTHIHQGMDLLLTGLKKPEDN